MVTATAAPPPDRRRRPEPPHQHDPRPGEPADWNGRQVCNGPEGCGLLGKRGDPRHPVAAPPLAEARRAAGAAGNARKRVVTAPADVAERDRAIRRRFDVDDD